MLSRLTLFPIKSLDGWWPAAAAVLPSGALAGDRAWALRTADGVLLNAKRSARLHTLRATFREAGRRVALAAPGVPPGEFLLDADTAALAGWLTAALGEPVSLDHDPFRGFPDDLEAPGPTLVSTATLAAVAEWFGLGLDEARRRFRTNLEVGGVPAFWEDALAGESPAAGARLRIGGAVWRAANVCQRCAVPARDSRGGEAQAGFQREFMRRREAALPAGAPRARFNHFYRLTLNLAPVTIAAGAVVRVGDAVEVLPQ